MNGPRRTVLRLLVAAILAVAPLGCGEGSDPAPPAGSPSSAMADNTARQTVRQFFSALRRDEVAAAEAFVAPAAIDDRAIQELASRGGDVHVAILGVEGSRVRLSVRANPALRYWPPCSFSFLMRNGGSQIGAEESCPAPTRHR